MFDYGKVGEKLVDMGGFEVDRLNAPIEFEEAFDPVNVGLFSSDAVVACLDLFLEFLDLCVHGAVRCMYVCTV